MSDIPKLVQLLIGELESQGVNATRVVVDDPNPPPQMLGASPDISASAFTTQLADKITGPLEGRLIDVGNKIDTLNNLTIQQLKYMVSELKDIKKYSKPEPRHILGPGNSSQASAGRTRQKTFRSSKSSNSAAVASRGMGIGKALTTAGVLGITGGALAHLMKKNSGNQSSTDSANYPAGVRKDVGMVARLTDAIGHLGDVLSGDFGWLMEPGDGGPGMAGINKLMNRGLLSGGWSLLKKIPGIASMEKKALQMTPAQLKSTFGITPGMRHPRGAPGGIGGRYRSPKGMLDAFNIALEAGGNPLTKSGRMKKSFITGNKHASKLTQLLAKSKAMRGIMGKAAVKASAGKIPFANWGISSYFAKDRMDRGDYMGAFLDMASPSVENLGVALAPKTLGISAGVGTGLSYLIDGLSVARDLSNVNDIAEEEAIRIANASKDQVMFYMAAAEEKQALEKKAGESDKGFSTRQAKLDTARKELAVVKGKLSSTKLVDAKNVLGATTSDDYKAAVGRMFGGMSDEDIIASIQAMERSGLLARTNDNHAPGMGNMGEISGLSKPGSKLDKFLSENNYNTGQYYVAGAGGRFKTDAEGKQAGQGIFGALASYVHAKREVDVADGRVVTAGKEIDRVMEKRFGKAEYAKLMTDPKWIEMRQSLITNELNMGGIGSVDDRNNMQIASFTGSMVKDAMRAKVMRDGGPGVKGQPAMTNPGVVPGGSGWTTTADGAEYDRRVSGDPLLSSDPALFAMDSWVGDENLTGQTRRDLFDSAFTGNVANRMEMTGTGVPRYLLDWQENRNTVGGRLHEHAPEMYPNKSAGRWKDLEKKYNDPKYLAFHIDAGEGFAARGLMEKNVESLKKDAPYIYKAIQDRLREWTGKTPKSPKDVVSAIEAYSRKTFLNPLHVYEHLLGASQTGVSSEGDLSKPGTALKAKVDDISTGIMLAQPQTGLIASETGVKSGLLADYNKHQAAIDAATGTLDSRNVRAISPEQLKEKVEKITGPGSIDRRDQAYQKATGAPGRDLTAAEADNYWNIIYNNDDLLSQWMHVRGIKGDPEVFRNYINSGSDYDGDFNVSPAEQLRHSREVFHGTKSPSTGSAIQQIMGTSSGSPVQKTSSASSSADPLTTLNSTLLALSDQMGHGGQASVVNNNTHIYSTPKSVPEQRSPVYRNIGTATT